MVLLLDANDYIINITICYDFYRGYSWTNFTSYVTTMESSEVHDYGIDLTAMLFVDIIMADYSDNGK